MKKLLLILTLAVIAMTFVSLAACSEAKSDLEDVKWILTSYGPQGDLKTPLADTQITVTFKSDTKDVTGSAGCNSYSGTYVIVGDKLTMVESFGVTEMWCGEEKDVQEKAYLNILLNAESFTIDGDTLVINCGSDILNYERG